MDNENVDDAVSLAFGDEWDQLAYLNSLEENDNPSQTGLLRHIMGWIADAFRGHPVRQE